MGVAKRHAHMIYEDEDGKRRVALSPLPKCRSESGR